MRRAAACAICLIVFTGVVAGHDLYLMPEAFHVPEGQAFELAVHNGDGFPDSQSAPPMARLRDATVHTARGRLALGDLRLDGTRALARVSGTSGDAVLTLVAAANVITMEPGEFHEYLTEEGLTTVLDTRKRRGESDAPARERYTKFAKTIVRAGQGDGGFARPAGLPLEFVPERDPFTAGRGEALPVRLLFNGAPAAGVQVIAASTRDPKPRPIGRTDAAGRIHVPLDAGRWRLHAVLMERSAEPAVAEWESYWATLTFEVR